MEKEKVRCELNYTSTEADGRSSHLILQCLTFGIKIRCFSKHNARNAPLGSLMPQLATASRVFSGERASASVSDGISLVAVNNIVDNDIGRSEKGDKSPSDKPSSSAVEFAKYLRLTKSGYLPSINSSAAAKARRGSLRASRRRTWSDGLWLATY